MDHVKVLLGSWLGNGKLICEQSIHVRCSKYIEIIKLSQNKKKWTYISSFRKIIIKNKVSSSAKTNKSTIFCK